MTKKKERENLSDLSVDELIEKWRQVKGLLESLEDDYRKAEISEDSYKEAKQKNERKFKQLTEILAGWGITKDQLEAKPAEAAGGGDAGGAAGGGGSEAGSEAAGEAKTTDKAGKKPAETKETKPAKAEESAPSTGQAAAPAQPPTQPGVSMDVIEAKMDTKLEKLSANIDTLKETNSGLSERMSTLNESIGELRSQGTQREGVIKDLQNKMETVDEQVSSISPQKYSKALEKRDKTAGKQDMRIEKLEMKTSDIAKVTGDIRRLLESVGGLENVSNVSKDMRKRLVQVKELYDEIQKLSSRIEKIYIELNKRMENFAVYRSKQENIEGVVKDVIKSVDAVAVRMDDYVTIVNFDNLKKSITDLEIKINTLQEMIGKVIPVARMKIPQPIQDLQEEQEAIQSLMDSLESEYNEGRMKKAAYDVIKNKNVKKIKQIQDALKNEWGRFEKILTGSAKAGTGQAPSQQPKGPEKQVDEVQHEASTENKPLIKKKPAPGKTVPEVVVKKKPLKPITPEKPSKPVQPKPITKEPVPTKPLATKPVPSKPAITKPVTKKTSAGAEFMAMGKMAKQLETGKKAKKIKPAAVKKLIKKPMPVKKPKQEQNKQPKVKAAEPKPSPPMSEKDSMLVALEDSYKKGLLSKEVYEKTKKMLES
jgi:chromosome segregation ATPase